MKHLLLVILTQLTFSAFGQGYPFVRQFVNGTIVLKDSSQRQGQLKWFPHQHEKLRFREGEDGETIKYSPEDIAGFWADTLKFVSLHNFDACAESYDFLGKTSKIKHHFAQVIDSGKFNIYFVLVSGYNAIGGAIQSYPNFLFQSTADSDLKMVPYPVAIRMKKNKYDKAKENLYVLFKDHPSIVEKLKNYNQQDDFYEIVNMVKAINH